MTTTFWAVECLTPQDWDDAALLEAAPRPPGVRSWTRGEKFPQPVTGLLEFKMDPSHNDRLTEMHNVQALLLTKRLHKALMDAGVTSLDAYPCVIRHPGTGKEINDYVACNVIQKTPIKEATDRDLLFRLAENTSAILVHDKVKKQLEAQGFGMLKFVPLDQVIDLDA